MFSPRMTYSPSGASAYFVPTMMRSNAPSRTRLENWSKERITPMILRPSRSTTITFSARGRGGAGASAARGAQDKTRGEGEGA